MAPAFGLVPAHLVSTVSLPLLAALCLAGVGSAVLAGLGLAAFVRRRSRSFLLVALALGALLARTVVAAAYMLFWITFPVHHVLEHVLDVAMAALVLAAVYYARSVEATEDAAENPEGDRL